MKQRNDTDKLVDAFFHVAFQKTEVYQDEVKRYEAIADEQGGVSPEFQKTGRSNAMKRIGAMAAVLVVCIGLLVSAPKVIGFEWSDIFLRNGIFSNEHYRVKWGEYELRYVPDGFVQTNVAQQLVLEKDELKIEFWYTAQDSQGRVSGENLQEFALHGRKALLMSETIGDQTWNVVLYYFGSDLLTLKGNVSDSELIKIAENIEKIK